MSTLITTANIQGYLVPGLQSSTIDYVFYQNEYKQIFTIIPSEKDTEVDIESIPLTGGGQFFEGGTIASGSMAQVFTTYSKIYNYGVRFQITKNAVEDNLYPQQFPKGLTGIKDFLQIYAEGQGISIFDNGFSTSVYKLADDQPFFSTSHPIQGGTVSNTLTPTGLNETSVQDLIKVIQYFKDAGGLQRKFQLEKLLVGIENQYAAQIVVGSTYLPGTANNDVNPIPYGEYIPAGMLLNHYMSSPKFWYGLTNLKGGLIQYRRRSLFIEMTTDPNNQNLNVVGSERYRFNVINFRSAAGVQSF